MRSAPTFLLMLMICLLDGVLSATITPTTNVPTNVTFYLVKEDDSVTDMYIGSKVHFKLGVHFPQGTLDIQVELFTPDNETTLMVICDPKITSVGSNLNVDANAIVPTKDAKDGTFNYDRAVINLGSVTNDGVDTSVPEPSLLIIEWDAVMIETSRTDINGSVFWVSAGAEYNNENEVWVGQISFVTYDTAYTPPTPAAVNLTGPDTMELGSSATFTLELYLPLSSASVVVTAFAPLNETGIVTINALVLKSTGNNFKCIDRANYMHNLTASSSGKGNERGQLDLGTLTNSRSREVTPYADSILTIAFSVYMYEEGPVIGQSYPVGAAIEIGTQQIWTGQVEVQATAATPAAFQNMTGTPEFNLTTTDASPIAPGQNTLFTMEVSPPLDTEARYLLEVHMPYNDSARMKACRAEITYLGINLPSVVEAKPVYSAKDNTTNNRITWDLGIIKNHGFRTTAEDSSASILRVNIVAELLNHTLNTEGEQLWVSVGVQFSAERLWVGQTDVTITTTTTYNASNAPTFAVAYQHGTEYVQVGASTAILLDLTIQPGALHPPMDVEFLTPYQNDSAMFTICRAELLYVGANLPCIDQTTVNSSVTYFAGSSTANATDYTRAVVPLGYVCSVGTPNATATVDDLLRLKLTVRVEDHVALENGTVEWLAAGTMYAETRLWVGQIALNAVRDDSVALPQNGTIYSTLEEDPLSVGQGETFESNLIVKVPPQSTFKLSLDVTTCADVSLCAVFVAEAGSNLPCSNVLQAGNVTWDANRQMGLSALLPLGYLSNTDLDEAINETSTFDNNTLKIRTVGRALPTAAMGGCSVSWSLTVDGVATTLTQTVNIQAPVTTTNGSTSTPLLNYYMAALEENATTPNGSLYKGESALFRLDITPSETTADRMVVKFMTPSNASQPMALCGMNLVHAGANVVCLKRGSIPATLESRNNDHINDIATIDLGSVCQYPLHTDSLSKTLTLEAVARLRPDADVNPGDTFWFSVAVMINDDTIYVGQLDVTVAASFNEELFNSSELAVPPALTVETATSAVELTPTAGTFYDLPVNLTIPPNKTVSVAADVSLPVNQTACMTVVAVTVTRAGVNLGCGLVNATDAVNTTYTSSNGTSQNDKAYTNIGLITNSGMTYRTENVQDEDNQLSITVRVQLADCISNEDQADVWLSLGAKIGPIITIVDKLFRVTRTGSDRQELVLTSSLDDPTRTYNDGDTIEAGGCLKHADNSTAEAQNVRVSYLLPPYLDFGLLTSTNGSTPTVVSLSQATGVALMWEDVFFTDHICFNFTLTVNLGAAPGATQSAVGVARATTPYQASGSQHDRSGSIYPDGKVFYTRMDHLPINVTATCGTARPATCTAQALGMEDGSILGCQLSSSSPTASISQVRKGSSTPWTSAARCSGYPIFLDVNFGNQTLVTRIWLEQQTTSGFAAATAYTLWYSDDGATWTAGEQVTSVTANHDHSLTCPTETRHLRLEVTATSPASTDLPLGLRLEFYGCPTSAEKATDFCVVENACVLNVPPAEIKTEMLTRPFLAVGNSIYFCDVNPLKRSVLFPEGERLCYKSEGCSNNKWEALDDVVISIIGYDSKDSVLYGISRDQKGFLMSKDDGLVWYSVSVTRFTTAKAGATFIAAINADSAYSADFQLSVTSPVHYVFSANAPKWGAAYGGLYCDSGSGWTKKVDWCFVN